jgi:amidase
VTVSDQGAPVSGIIKTLDIRDDCQSASTSAFATTGGLDGDARPAAGLTFAVKDMIDLAGHRSSFGCPDWLKTHQAAAEHAPCVQTLLAVGAHLTATTVCDELAFSLDGINVHYGTPLNCRDQKRIPGGSSSGPASVVAQGLVDFALGTDTAGSTRVPASYQGIWGLRPSVEAISSAGVLPLGPSFDTVGLLTATLPVMQTLVDIFFPPDQNQEEEDKAGANPPRRPRRLILMTDAFALLQKDMQPAVMAAAAKLAEQFEQFEEKIIAPQGLADLVKHFGRIRAFEAWQCHGHWYEAVQPHLADFTRERLLACRSANAAEAEQSRLVRANLQAQYDTLLQDAVLCLPTTAAAAPLKTSTSAELEANRNLNLQLNATASFLGLPQLTVPVEAIAGIDAPPLCSGISLIGRVGSERQLLTLASRLTGML